jgi:hypothetical protein
MKNTCPPVTVNVDAIVKAVKESMVGEIPAVEAEVHSARVKGLGFIKGLMPSASQFDGTSFVLGYSLIPPVVNFASKLADEGVIFPKVDKTLFRGVATGVTLIAQLLTCKSFLLGSLIGQIPTTLDSLADLAVGAVKTAKGLKGLGATPDEELQKLRMDLERLSAVDGAGIPEDISGLGEDDDEMAGVGGGRGVVFGR